MWEKMGKIGKIWYNLIKHKNMIKPVTIVTPAWPWQHSGVSEALSEFLFPEGGRSLSVWDFGFCRDSRDSVYHLLKLTELMSQPGDEPLKEHLRCVLWSCGPTEKELNQLQTQRCCLKTQQDW
jgi:hypothetical protein